MATELNSEALCDNSFIACPNRGAIRLQDGANEFEGRVEVCGIRSGTNQTLIWKTVCNAGWDEDEAQVVCRQLGFPSLNCELSLTLHCNL